MKVVMMRLIAKKNESLIHLTEIKLLGFTSIGHCQVLQKVNGLLKCFLMASLSVAMFLIYVDKCNT